MFYYHKQYVNIIEFISLGTTLLEPTNKMIWLLDVNFLIVSVPPKST